MRNKDGCDMCKYNLDGKICNWDDNKALLLEEGECDEFASLGLGEQ